MDPESLMQRSTSPARSSYLNDICCIIFVIGLIIFNIFTLGNGDPLQGTISTFSDPFTLLIIGMTVLFVGINIYQRTTAKTRIRNHILRYMDNRVPIVNLMKELNLPFLDLVYFIEQMKKKKIPVEINERTGEVLVGDVPIRKSTLVEKSSKKSVLEMKKDKCPQCSASVSSGFQYCDHCGSRIVEETKNKSG